MMAVRVLSAAEYNLFKTTLTSLADSPNREAETGESLFCEN
jgi:hypothetical protein